MLEALEQARFLFGVDAGPGVGHFKAQALIGTERGQLQTDHAALGEFDRVIEQIEQDLPDTGAIATGGDVAKQPDFQAEAQATLLRQWRHQRPDLSHELTHRKRLHIQLQPSGFDARKVQRIVDQPQQMRARAPDGLGVTALLDIQRGLEQQLTHAQDPSHRRTHFVAQRRQKTRLGQRRLLGHFLFVHRELPGIQATQPTAVQQDGCSNHAHRQQGQQA